MPIQLLSPDTIGKIAAGEVVERPASAVKELLENALDAGATRVAVEVRGGGIDLIEISDDGRGIVAAEVPMALQRYATSKLQRFEDLDSLQTLGFRGEALASIAAVSALTLRTHSGDEAAGTVTKVDFGEVGPTTAAAAPVGMTVTVRDLFANVPARRKFLRQPGTEHGYIGRVVAAYACAYPHVRFTLTVEGRTTLATDGSGDPVAAASGVFGLEVGRAALLLAALEESAEVPGVSVAGWIGAPSVTRSHRQDMIFFVNGRWIQSRSLGYALEEAYHSLLMVGRRPIAFVHLTVDPAALDVNVHPTKAEIKFQDERSAARGVSRAAHQALLQTPHDVLPAVTFTPSITPVTARQADFATPAALGFARTFEPRPESEPVSSSTAPHQRLQSGVPVMRVLGQVGGNYIVAEGPSGMYLIDQHAAHERVMYEKILAQMQGAQVERQSMLDPLIVELTPEEHAVFERSRDELAQIGFEIDPFGGTTVALRAVPALVRNVDIAERLHLILDELGEGGVGRSWLDSVAISAACHTSIRAGQALSLAEMRELVAELERCAQPRACGHGRPTMIHLSQIDLEKQFSRR